MSKEEIYFHPEQRRQHHRQRLERGKNEENEKDVEKRKIQTVTAVVRATDREFNHQTSSSSPLLLNYRSIDSII